MATVASLQCSAYSNLSEYISHWAASSPRAQAVVCGDRRLSYFELNKRVRLCAAALWRNGVRPGDRVAVISPPNENYLVTLLATIAVRAIWVGLNPKYQRDELAHYIADAHPVILFCYRKIESRDYSSDIAWLKSDNPHLESLVAFDDGQDPTCPADDWIDFLQGGPAQMPPVGPIEPSDPAVMVYTSGSTGDPKGAVISNAAMVGYAEAQNRLWPVDTVSSLNYFPINHVGCVIDVTAPTLVAGGVMTMLESFDPVEALRLMEREKVTIWGSVPSVFQMQLSLPNFQEFDLSNVRLIVWGGGAMPESVVQTLLTLGVPLATNYAMTESTGAITLVEPTDDIDVLANSVGCPIEGVEVEIREESGALCAGGVPGEIFIRSKYLAAGYWRGQGQGLSKLASNDGWFATGDLGIFRPDGRLKIVGRIKEMYKSGGYNVYPSEVEAVLSCHPTVAAASVVCINDPVWQESGVAFVISLSEVSEKDLTEFCRAKLANYKIPKHIQIVDHLPLLPVGKVDKKALQATARALYEEQSS